MSSRFSYLSEAGAGKYALTKLVYMCLYNRKYLLRDKYLSKIEQLNIMHFEQYMKRFL